MALTGCAKVEVRLAVRRELEQPIVVDLDVDDNRRINVARSRHVVLVGVGNLERNRPLETPGSMSIGASDVGIVLKEIAVTASLWRANGHSEFWFPGMEAREFRNSCADSSAAYLSSLL